MKATYAEINGEERLLFKNPKMDDGTKCSVAVFGWAGQKADRIAFTGGLTKGMSIKAPSLLETVFEDGKLLRDESLSEIGERLAS